MAENGLADTRLAALQAEKAEWAQVYATLHLAEQVEALTGIVHELKHELREAGLRREQA